VRQRAPASDTAPVAVPTTARHQQIRSDGRTRQRPGRMAIDDLGKHLAGMRRLGGDLGDGVVEDLDHRDGVRVTCECRGGPAEGRSLLAGALRRAGALAPAESGVPATRRFVSSGVFVLTAGPFTGPWLGGASVVAS
jgi:hypothetical protein